MIQAPVQLRIRRLALHAAERRLTLLYGNHILFTL